MNFLFKFKNSKRLKNSRKKKASFNTPKMTEMNIKMRRTEDEYIKFSNLNFFKNL